MIDPVGAMIVNSPVVELWKLVQNDARELRGGRQRICAGCETLTDVSEYSKLLEFTPDPVNSTLQVVAEPCEAGGDQISISFTRSDWKIEVTCELVTVHIPPAAPSKSPLTIAVVLPEVDVNR